jgi:zinc/manganese transport system ATP-binding protein
VTGPAIAASDLSAVYGSRSIWTGATFEIPAGSFTAILGPNGSGKSTLVRLVLGLLTPAKGDLKVLGDDPHRGNPRIGYVPQGSYFDPELSIRGRDFVGLGVDGHMWGMRVTGRQRAEAETEKAIASVHAEEYADLVGMPQLLLLDEPLSHLDVRNQQAIVQLISEVARERHLTVLLIAHDVNPLLPHIDHVLYVAQGKLAMGKPNEIITSESLSRIYSSPVEVLKDSRGRVFVVGLEEEVSHPHD